MAIFEREPCPINIRAFIPETPVNLGREDADRCFREGASVMSFRCVLVFSRHLFRVFYDRLVLYFVIRIMCSSFPIRVVLSSVLGAWIRRSATVFSSEGEGVSVVGFIRWRFRSLLGRLVGVFPFDSFVVRFYSYYGSFWCG